MRRLLPQFNGLQFVVVLTMIAAVLVLVLAALASDRSLFDIAVIVLLSLLFVTPAASILMSASQVRPTKSGGAAARVPQSDALDAYRRIISGTPNPSARQPKDAR